MKKAFLICLVMVLLLISSIPLCVKAETIVSSPTTQSVGIAVADIENQIVRADLILTGKVTNTMSYWNTAGTAIFTDVEILIEHLIKGMEIQPEITIVINGGTVGDWTQTVSGHNKFELQYRAVFFLTKNEDDNYQLLSDRNGVDGLYLIDENNLVADTDLYVFIDSIVRIMTRYKIPTDLPERDKEQLQPLLLSPPEIKAESDSIPSISSIIPSFGSAGANTQIIINGNNFGSVQDSSRVTFYYRRESPRIEATINSWEDNRIVATVPIGVINGRVASASSGPVIVTTSSGDSHPFHFTVPFSFGDKWSTTDTSVQYVINPNAVGVIDEELAIKSAATTWSTVSDSDFNFSYGGQTTTESPIRNGINEVMWGDIGADGPVAITSLWSTSSKGLVEFDLEFNSNYLWSTNGAAGTYDVQSVATHEFGHALGLRDIYGDIGYPDDTEKVMYGFASEGVLKRELTTDDIAGICWIYPVTSDIKLGGGGFSPSAIGINQATNRVYVGNNRSNNVSVIDSMTNEIITTVDVGNGPQGLAVNNATNRIYVTNGFGNTVSVIEGMANAVIATVEVGILPFRLDVNEITNQIYVANSGSNTVSVIDGASNTTIGTINVGVRPAGIGIDSSTNRIYVSNDGDNDVAVIDGFTNNVVATIGIGNSPAGIGVNQKNHKVYVANYGSNSVSVIDGTANNVLGTLSVGTSPRGITVDDHSNFVYIANEGSNNISVIDGDTDTVVESIDVGNRPVSAGFNKINNRLYVANYGSNDVSVIDGATLNLIQSVNLGHGPDAIVFNPAQGHIYVANNGSSSIAVVDRNTNTLLTTIDTGSHPAGLGINLDTNRLYVANSTEGSILVIDGNTNEILTTVSVGSRPADIAVNPVTNRVYVANNGGASVSVINGADNSVITTISVGYLPIGVAVNPTTNRIYVSNNYNNTVSVIDGDTNGLISTVSVGAWPMGIAINPLTNLIYVVNNGGNSVSVIDGLSNTVVSGVNVGMSPRNVAVNAAVNHIYVTNNGDDSISVIDGMNNVVMTTFNVGKGPRGVGVYPETNDIYVSNYWADDVSLIQDETNTPAVPVRLSFAVQPDNINVVEENFITDPIVIAFDERGQRVTSYYAPINISIMAGTGNPGAQLVGSTTINASSGVAVFSGLSIDLPGKGYTLLASSGSLINTISNLFDIVAVGDANGDGSVNVGDIVVVEMMILQKRPENPGADANSDGVINVVDIIKIERIILGLNSTPIKYGLCGFQPVFPDGPNDLVGVRYRFKVTDNQSQSNRLIFGVDRLHNPGSEITYLIESNVYSGRLTYEDGVCTTWPLLGTYTEHESSLRVAVPDYPFNFGQQDGITTGIRNNDPLNWPIQTYLIDNIPNLYKSDAINQFNNNGIETLVTIERGDTLSDVSGFRRDNRSLLPGIYRRWIVRVEMSGRPVVENEIVVPDGSGRYLTVNEALSFLSEYLNQPGAFTVQYWELSSIRESDRVWRPLTEFTSSPRYDGNGSDYGIRVVNINGQNRIEFSNHQRNIYLVGGIRFSY